MKVSPSGYLLPTDSKKELSCKDGYSGSVTAECTLDGEWEVSGSCGGGGGESSLKPFLNIEAVSECVQNQLACTHDMSCLLQRHIDAC